MDYQMEERGTGLLLWNLRRSQPVCTEEQPNAGRKIHHNRVEMAREIAETAAISGGIFFAMAALSVIGTGMGNLSLTVDLERIRSDYGNLSADPDAENL